MRDFGDTLEGCLVPITEPDNFCEEEEKKLTDIDAPNSIIRYRNVSGICNNLQQGKAAIGAGDTITGRFFKRKSLDLNFHFTKNEVFH